MLTNTEIIVLLAGIVNIAWAFHNWQVRRGHLKLFSLLDASSETMKAEGVKLLRNAKQIVKDAELEQQHAFCHTCGRIVTRHTTVEGRSTCINCAADKLNLAKKTHA